MTPGIVYKLLLGGLAALLSGAAPAPQGPAGQPRGPAPAAEADPEPPPELLPGRYTMTFNGTVFDLTVLPGHGHVHRGPDNTWQGTYRWCRGTRTLTFTEEVAGSGHWHVWSAVLGRDLAGAVTGSHGPGEVRFVRAR